MMDTWSYNAATQIQTQLSARPGELTRYRQRMVIPPDSDIEPVVYGPWGEWRTVPQDDGIGPFLDALGGMQGLAFAEPTP